MREAVTPSALVIAIVPRIKRFIAITNVMMPNAKRPRLIKENNRKSATRVQRIAILCFWINSPTSESLFAREGFKRGKGVVV